MTRFLVIVAFLVSSFNLLAQVDRVAIFGVVKDERSGLKLEGVTIVLLQDGKEVNKFVTSLNGKFDLELGFDHSFDVRFVKDGFVTKFLNIDTRNVPANSRVGGFGFDLDMTLFKNVEGVNFDILKQPIGIAKYNPAKEAVEFDYEYTKSIQAEIAKLRKALEKKYQEEEDKINKEQQLAEAEKLKQQKFEQLVKEGDEQMAASNYTNAIFKFSEALDLKPATKYVEDKLAAAKKAQNDLDATKKLEQQYKDLLAKADNLFLEKKYQESILAYTEANKVKPNEGYPKEKIKEAQVLLAAIAKEKALNDDFKAQLAKGDSTFKANKFDQALVYYQNAAKLKPEDAVLKQKITDTQAKQADLERVKIENEKFAGILKQADDAFKGNNYDAALSYYKQASELKPADPVAKQKIVDTQARLDALAKQKQLDEQYKAVLSKADDAFAKNSFQEALDGYKQATALKTAEAYPKAKIIESQNKMAELAKKDALEKQYADLISKADAAMSGNQYQAALTSYQQASVLKPSEDYPKTKLAEAKLKLDELAKLKATDDQYKALITKADAAFTAKQYSAALNSYKQAADLKNTEEYPKLKAKELQSILDDLAKQKAIDNDYQKLLFKGDSVYKLAKYEDAIALYNQALDVKPTELAPKTKIADANAKLDALAKQKSLDEQYKTSVNKADELFAAEKWEEAIAGYKAAATLKPAELYPKNKTSEAQAKLAIIAKQKASDEQYSKLIQSADSAFTAGLYSAALNKYQQASTAKPTEQYPKDKLAATKTKIEELAKIKATDDQYKALITKADAAFNAAKYQEAIASYTQATALKNNETYPKERMDAAQAKINEIEKEKLDKDNAYKTAIANGDASFEKNDFNNAKVAYNEALKIKPSEAYPKQKITESDAKLAQLAKQSALEKQYSDLIIKADAALAANQYQVAISTYQQASVFKPTEQYPKDKMAEGKNKLEELAKQKAADDQYKLLLTKADVAFNTAKYQEAIASYTQAAAIKSSETYPKERIDAAQAKINEIEKAKLDKENAYKSYLSDGDTDFAKGDFVSAKIAYNEALKLKPAEAYPKQKITEADAKLADIAKKTALDKQYTDVIARADAAMAGNQYANALAAYQQASTLKPTEQYPKDKLAEAKTALDDLNKQKSLEEQYKSTIAKADAAFAVNKFTEATAAYQQASVLKPNETYPKDRIVLINDKLAELEKQKLEKEETYKDAISTADAAFAKGDYSEAKITYNEALKIKPAETYPKQKIAEADVKLAELTKQTTLNNQYKDLIAKADAALTSNNYALAISNYQQAGGLKPTEQYPKDKLAEAKTKLEEQNKLKNLDDQYKGLLTKADADFKLAKYELAYNSYQQASTIKPTESYPKDQAAAAQAKMNELNAEKLKNAQYKSAITKADSSMLAKNFEQAISDYETALSIKPTEAYPKTKINEAIVEKEKLAKNLANSEKYNTLINAGDQAFQQGEWKMAVNSYTDASALKPTEAYPKQKIKEAEVKLLEIEKLRLAKELKYNTNISRGDSSFTKKSYQAAINFYTEARKAKPGEAYPKNKIAEAEAKLEELAKLETDKKAADAAKNVAKPVVQEPADPTIVSFKDITSFGEIKKDTVKTVAKKVENDKPAVMYRTTPVSDVEAFRRELGANYPEGKTEEKFNEGNKDVFRTIYVQNKLGDEYLKIVAKFGTFYFKNGGSIAPNDFQREVSQLK